MLDGLSAGLMSQVGDAAFGPMGKQMMFTGKQLVNDSVCHILSPFFVVFLHSLRFCMAIYVSPLHFSDEAEFLIYLITSLDDL